MLRRSLSLLIMMLVSYAARAENPIITDVFSADPAAMVHNNTVYLYTGHDEAPNNDMFFEMHDWLVFSSSDMVNWQAHGPIMQGVDFKWAQPGFAWAAHMIEKNGTFYFYATVRHDDTKPGFAIGVATSKSPTGPFTDAIGKALVTDDMTQQTPNDWDDIDPAIFIEDNGDAYLFFGNLVPKYVKLKDNMLALDGEIKTIHLRNFTEASWVHKKGNHYYLSYACQFPEKICYAMSKSIHGPWEYQGILNEVAGNSETNHQSIIEYKGKSYFIYHTGALPPKHGEASGGRFRRSVAIEPLYYNEDGTLKPVVMTTKGVQK